MLNTHSYTSDEILTLNMRDYDNLSDLFTKLRTLTKLPMRLFDVRAYVWDGFRGTLEVSPVFVCYHFDDFKRRFFADASIMYGMAWRHFMQNNKIIIVLDGPLNGPFWSNPFVCKYLFIDHPSQFGLRGDIPLWEMLGEYFYDKVLVDDEAHLPQQIYEAIETLTGHSVEPDKTFYVPEFNRGGMSGGMVSCKFWLDRGMDYLIARHRKLKAVQQHLSARV